MDTTLNIADHWSSLKLKPFQSSLGLRSLKNPLYPPRTKISHVNWFF
jgi:hypothetical protein